MRATSTSFDSEKTNLWLFIGLWIWCLSEAQVVILIS